MQSRFACAHLSGISSSRLARLAMTNEPSISLPRHQRSVDHVLHAFVADRADGEVDILEPELVGGHQLERKAVRGELCERELACPVAVAARALDGDELH